MAVYKYTAINKAGEKISGTVEGATRSDAAQRIRQTCNIILKLTEEKPKKKSILSMEIGGSRINEKAFSLMCSQFAVILQSGVPLRRTIHLVADKMSDKKLKSILTEVAQDVESGHSLSESFRERGGSALSSVFIETIAAGEETGNLSDSFRSMYEHFDKQIKRKAKVKSALSYPIFVITLSVVIVIVLMVKVVPMFVSMFDFYEEDLPWITQSLIGISLFFRKYILHMIVIAAVLGVFCVWYGNTERGKLRLSKWALSVPVLGNIRMLSCASEFAGNLTALLASGLTLPRAVLVVSRVIGNYYISKEVGKMPEKLESGKTMGECMREAECLPDILVDMTAVGAESGELEKTLSTIAAYYDSELESAIQMALRLLEPILLVIIAVVAGYIVLAVYIAMFQMYSLMA